MALVLLAGSFTMPKTNVVRMPSHKPSGRRSLATIKCGGKPSGSDAGRARRGGQTNSNKKKENGSLGLNSSSENAVKKTDGGLDGVTTPKKTTSTASN